MTSTSSETKLSLEQVIGKMPELSLLTSTEQLRLQQFIEEAPIEVATNLDKLKQVALKFRHIEWANKLENYCREQNIFWADRSDFNKAISGISILDPSIDLLVSSLSEVLSSKWNKSGLDHEKLLHEIVERTEEDGHLLSLSDMQKLSAQIAGSARPNSATNLFAEREFNVQETRRQVKKQAELARKKQEDELKAWEESLLPFSELPSALNCTRKEALRWVAEQRIPVARRTESSDGRQDFFFDPKKIADLIPSIYEWRNEAKPSKTNDKKEVLNPIDNAMIAQVAALDKFAAHFKTARSLKRRITLVTGPTNSGKSYTALKALTEAKSGVALAPLRLLAHEFRDTMMAKSVPTSLITGEERQIIPGARHIAATVEMCPLHNPIDVAIIDEAQMLLDPDRGAAWTTAIMGVPASHVFVLGAPDCRPLVKNIASLCGDPMDEIKLDRKSPLIAGKTVKLSDLKRGDALIAFSRKEVLDLRAELMKRGKKVAVIYGALSPDVRCAEAARFNSGEAEIMIATDAIGMGLNLSIQRIVFSKLEKYDGKQTRGLTSQEIKQIGGRAGRYGKHEKGIVCVLENGGSPIYMHKMLEAPPEPISDIRPQVQPDIDIIQAVAEEIGSESLYGVLTRIKHAVLQPNDPNYRLADLEQPLEIAAALEGVKGLTLRERWTYSVCPIDMRDYGLERLIDWAVLHAQGRAVAPPSLGKLPTPANTSRDELARAEKCHRRLVSWRWLAMRFPEIYQDIEHADEHAKELNDWIEQVLRTQSHMRENNRRRKDFKHGKAFKPREGKESQRPRGEKRFPSKPENRKKPFHKKSRHGPSRKQK